MRSLLPSARVYQRPGVRAALDAFILRQAEHQFAFGYVTNQMLDHGRESAVFNAAAQVIGLDQADQS